MNTPWGKADSVEQIAPGIKRVTTPSHGGYFLEVEENCKVPHVWRAASFNGQALKGWYEEDCDWCMVAMAFQHLFKPEHVEQARKTFDGWIKPKLSYCPLCGEYQHKAGERC